MIKSFLNKLHQCSRSLLQNFPVWLCTANWPSCPLRAPASRHTKTVWRLPTTLLHPSLRLVHIYCAFCNKTILCTPHHHYQKPHKGMVSSFESTRAPLKPVLDPRPRWELREAAPLPALRIAWVLLAKCLWRKHSMCCCWGLKIVLNRKEEKGP